MIGWPISHLAHPAQPALGITVLSDITLLFNSLNQNYSSLTNDINYSCHIKDVELV